MAPKTKRIVDIIATAIPSGLQYLPFLGMAEVCFALLFIPRKTMKLGFILLSCYFAGAMATELSHGMTPASPTITVVVVWIGAFIRDRSIFISLAETKHGT